MLPDAVSMLAALTKPGRPSSPRVKRVTSSKLRSTLRCWLRFSEYEPSTDALKRPSRIAPPHDKFPRTLRGGLKFGAERVTFGDVFENADPAVPSAHSAGMATGSVSGSQAGTGAAAPTQMSCWAPLGSPVWSSTEPTGPPLALAKTPTPPRSTARGRRDSPKKVMISLALPSTHVNPKRGLKATGVGMRSLRSPNAD